MALITGAEMVATFRSFEWVRYVWGGSSPGTGWDCSGAVNWIFGERYRLSIPGHASGQWTSADGHGPVVADWIQWSGVTRGDFPHVTPLPGDLIAWGPNTHMGMAFSATRFVSAANPNDGTIEADIATFFPYAPYVLRSLQVRTGATLPEIPRPPGPGADDYSPIVTRTAQHVNSAGLAAYTSAVAIRSLRY